MSFPDLWAEAGRLSDKASVEDHLAALSNHVPQSFTLDELAQFTEKRLELRTARQDLVAILACLQLADRSEAGHADPDAAARLAIAITRLIAPISKDDDEQDPYSRVAERTGRVAEVGLRALWQIFGRLSPSGAALDRQGLVTLVAFADSNEQWSSEKTASLANQIIDQQLPDGDRESFITEAILKSYLRPLFSKSRPSTVTESGRKAEYQDPDAARERALLDDRKAKPWKYRDLRAIPAFTWAIRQAPEALVNDVWHLLIPVLLTLQDDSTTRVRCRGLALTAEFLSKISGEVLQRTGLVGAFREAILPTLNFLPNITPEDESVQLLDPALDALTVLAERVSAAAKPAEANRMRDTIFREGIFSAFFHARDHVRIVELLFRHTAILVRALQIHAVKHLRDLIAMISSVITDPFGLSHPTSLLVAVSALQETIANCWPRLADGIWQDEIIKALVLGWVKMLDDSTPSSELDREKVRAELTKAARMLAAVAENAGMPLRDKVAPLLKKEPELRGLFS